MSEFITAIRTSTGDKKYDYNSLANLPDPVKVPDCADAIKGISSGKAICVDDISPIEHATKVWVHGKNLVAYPFPETTLTRYGVTYTDNGDGSITVNGTATANSHFIFKGKSNLPVGKYALSGCPAGGGVSTYYITVNGFSSIKSDIGNGGSLEVKSNSPQTNFVIIIMAGTTVTNLVFKPQLEKGESRTEYAPYVDPSTIMLTSYGKNLFDKSRVVDLAIGMAGGGNSDETILQGTSYRGFYIPCKEGDVYSISRTNTVCNRFRYAFTETVPSEGVPIFGASLAYGDYSSILKHENIVVPANAKYLFVYLSNQSDTIDGIQIEVGNSATSYEAFKSMATYTPDADGTCDIISVSPTMTIISDTADTTIECEYNRDANIVISELIDFINQGGSSPARIVDIAIYANKWVGTQSPYSQVVTVAGATERSQVDLTPSVEQLSIFHNKDLAFVTENEDGVVTVYAIGQKPENDYIMQATVTEVNI